MTNYVEARFYYPDGMDRDDMNRHHFQVVVMYRGNGKWAVTTSFERNPAEQLSKSGNWLWMPSKMNQMRWCRFDSFEEACRVAERAVETRTVGGMTYAEFVEWRKTA